MEEDTNVDEITLNTVQEFTYLDGIIERDGHIEAELQKIMSKASMSFGREILNKIVLEMTAVFVACDLQL